MAKDAHTPPKELLNRFRELAAIPRPSKSEKQAREWVKSWAEEQGFSAEQDQAGNLRVSVPPRPAPGRDTEAPPTVALQGHLDMVCAVAEGVTHDCRKDGLSLVEEDDWLSAEGTSLGADDGVAVAAMMTLAEDRSLTIPPLELLFTVEEESGLTGAQKLSGEFLNAPYLINLDAQIEGTFVIGSAGGANGTVSLPVSSKQLDGSEELLELGVYGLRGGHSGLMIGEERGNAIRLLGSLLAAPPYVRIALLSGGHAGNAIPASARAVVAFPPNQREAVREKLKAVAGQIREGVQRREPDLHMTIGAPREASTSALDRATTERVIALIRALPHGPTELLEERPDQIKSSWNLAGVELKGGTVKVNLSQRSASSFSLKTERARVSAVAHLAGASIQYDSEYPPWEPKPDNGLVERAHRTYRSLFRRSPELLVAHGGLEVSFLQKALPNAEMISLGPTIEAAHTPQERLSISSLGKVYRLLTEVLSGLRGGAGR
jgi:dipeptidase D